MRFFRTPWAVLPVAAFSLANGAVIYLVIAKGAPAVNILASLILASPFGVLTLGHAYLARTWRRNVFLAVGSFAFSAMFAVELFVMAWFKPGFPGALVLGAGGVVLAGIFVALALLIPERKYIHPDKP